MEIAYRDWNCIGRRGLIPYETCLEPPWIEQTEVSEFRFDLQMTFERSVELVCAFLNALN